MKRYEKIRELRYDLLRTGDTFHSRSNKIHASIIAYATAWGKSSEGRKRARAAVKNPLYPNHSGNVLVSWGQRYPVEASPRGYIRGNFDEYCSREARIVSVYRWFGFDNPEVQQHAAEILERWARKATSPRYDLWGAIASSRLGRALMPWLHNKDDRLFCSEGVVYLLVMCGYCDGLLMDIKSDLKEVQLKIKYFHSLLPDSMNPYDVALWQRTNPDFNCVTDYYVP